MVLGVGNEKFRVGRSGTFPLPLIFISLVGLSSMLTSCSTLGGVAGRTGVVGVNENDLLETSAALLPPEGPKVKDGAEGAEAVAIVPSANAGAALVSVAGWVGVDPNENGPGKGALSSFFAVSVLRSNENEGATDDCPPKRGCAGWGFAGSAGVVEEVGCPKGKVVLGASEVVASSTGGPELKLNGAVGLAAGAPAAVSAATEDSVVAGDGCAGLGTPNMKADGASFGDATAAASGSLGGADEAGGPNGNAATSVVVGALNKGTA